MAWLMTSDLLLARDNTPISAADLPVAVHEPEVVARDIARLFDDPACPDRRLSLAAIRARLGGYDRRDPDLREILFSMGARVRSGQGEAALWELTHADTPAPRPQRRKRRLRLRHGLLALICVLVLLAGISVVTAQSDAAMGKPVRAEGTL